LESIIEAAKAANYVINLSDCNLKDDERFRGKRGIAINPETVNEYGPEYAWETFDGFDFRGVPRKLLFYQV